MRLNGYRCDNCAKEQTAYIHAKDGIPIGWLAVNTTAFPVSSEWTFCSISCLYQWSSNRLEMEAKEVQDERRA
jgi:hypothetical protein